MSSTVHFGKGRSMTFGDPQFIDPTVAGRTERLLTDYVGVKLDRATHAKLKRLAEARQQPVTGFLREKILSEIADHEAAQALAPQRREPWR